MAPPTKTLYGFANDDGTFIFEENQRFNHTHSIEVSEWPPIAAQPVQCNHPDASKINDKWRCVQCNNEVESTGWQLVG